MPENFFAAVLTSLDSPSRVIHEMMYPSFKQNEDQLHGKAVS